MEVQVKYPKVVLEYSAVSTYKYVFAASFVDVFSAVFCSIIMGVCRCL